MGAVKRGNRLARIGATAIAAATVAAACTAAAASSASAATSGPAKATAVAAKTVSARSATPAAYVPPSGTLSRGVVRCRRQGSAAAPGVAQVRPGHDRRPLRRQHRGCRLGVPGDQRGQGDRRDRHGHQAGARPPEDVPVERSPSGRRPGSRSTRRSRCWSSTRRTRSR